MFKTKTCSVCFSFVLRREKIPKEKNLDEIKKDENKKLRDEMKQDEKRNESKKMIRKQKIGEIRKETK